MGLGARLLPREEFLTEFRAARDVVTELGQGSGTEAPPGVALHTLARATAPSVVL